MYFGFISRVHLYFLKGYVPLSKRVFFFKLPFWLFKKKHRKKMDKKWLMGVIIFTMHSKAVLSNSFYCFFSFKPSEKQISLEMLTYWKSLVSSQPFLKDENIIMAFSNTEVLNFNYTKLLLIWLTSYFKLYLQWKIYNQHFSGSQRFRRLK